ncbi:hypothetical protein C8J56DRAFT_923125 [Mycena floridula]|nr:hypothetical protein C8J56DRAFT_923125 [Mycena floridula]
MARSIRCVRAFKLIPVIPCRCSRSSPVIPEFVRLDHCTGKASRPSLAALETGAPSSHSLLIQRHFFSCDIQISGGSTKSDIGQLLLLPNLLNSMSTRVQQTRKGPGRTNGQQTGTQVFQIIKKEAWLGENELAVVMEVGWTGQTRYPSLTSGAALTGF